MKNYAINICLIPDSRTYEKCKKLNTIDTGEYNKNTKAYIPHATLVMKTIDENDLKYLKKELKSISFQKLRTKSLDFYFQRNQGETWNGVNLEKTSEIYRLQAKIIDITKKIKNKPKHQKNYIVQNFFAENIGIPLKGESYFLDKKELHITFGKSDITTEFIKSNFPKNIVFSKLVIGQMGNYGSVRKILFTKKANNITH